MLIVRTKSKVGLFAGVAAASLASIAMSGCALGTAALPTSSVSLVPQSGVVHGGQNPVALATITLWKAGTATGYGQGASSLYTTATDALGGFTLTGQYSCAAGDQLYITAYGGNSGGGTNSAMGLMAALGECNALKATAYIVINEATTIAGMTALQQFTKTTYGTSGLVTLAASGIPINIGAPASNVVGLANAFLTVNNLAPATTAIIPQSYGRSATIAGATATITVTPPYAKIATLANILASCVNSNDGTGISTACTSLFNSVKPSTQTSASADTVQAALDLATNPTLVGSATVAPYSLAAASAPFQPALTGAPNDWTLPLQFTSSSVVGTTTTTAYFFYQTAGLQVDSAGNIYAANDAGANNNATAPYNNSVTEFSPIGVPVAIYLNDGSLAYPIGLVLDPNNTIWVAEKFAGDIVKYVSAGTVVRAKVNGSRESAMASDSEGNIFVAAIDGHLYEATPATATNTQATSIGTLTTISSSYLAFDSKLNLWATATSTSSTNTDQYIDVFACTPSVGTACTSSTTNSYGTPTVFTAFPTVNSVKGFPAGIAFDNNDNAFITATNYQTVGGTYTSGYGCEFMLTLTTEAGTATPACSANEIAGMEEPGQAEIDGVGNIWVVDKTANTSFGQPISGINYNSTTSTYTSVSGTRGYPSSPVGTTLLQLDQSGNTWAAANNVGSAATITEVVGVVAPVYAPLSLALKNGSLGKSPQ